MRRAPTSEAIALSVKRSNIWRFFEEKHLSINMRARFDPAWVDYLLRVGNGADMDGEEGEIYLPDEIIADECLIDVVYGDLFTRQMSNNELASFLIKRAIIAPLNRTCEEYNNDIVNRLPGVAVEHTSVDNVVADTVEDGEYYTTEFLNTLDPSELPPHHLKLKAGVVCMLLRNLRVHDGTLILTGLRSLLCFTTLQRYTCSCDQGRTSLCGSCPYGRSFEGATRVLTSNYITLERQQPSVHVFPASVPNQGVLRV